MRPYFAIIKDSFRAAMASRVLYVLLFLITLLLVVLAPFHLRETLDWKLQIPANVYQPDQLVLRIVERRSEDKPIARIWELLPSELQGRMQKIAKRMDEAETTATDRDAEEAESMPGAPPDFLEQLEVQEELVGALNDIIEDRNFYRAEDWNVKLLPTEAKSLVDQGVETLTDVRVKRLNRLLIASCVSPTIAAGNATALEFYYAIWKTPITVSITQQQFAQTMTSQLPFFFEKFVMSIGLMIAIIVTANMVPETFEPGSLNLLLSKPITRWGLYTAKFVGGCVFISLLAGYLFLGVWLWMGLAMEIWDRAMLLSIPLYIVVFAIYFSVSAFVGLLWRSPVVSVILTLIFWAFCFSMGASYGALNIKMNNNEFVHLVPMEEGVLASDILQQSYSWNRSANRWDRELETDLSSEEQLGLSFSTYLQRFSSEPEFSNTIKPVLDRTHQHLIASRFKFQQLFGSGSTDMYVSGVDNIDFKPIGQFPRSTLQMFDTPEGLIAVTGNGTFQRLNSEKLIAAFRNHAAENHSTETTKTDKQENADSKAEKATAAKSETTTKPKPLTSADLFQSFGPLKPASIRSAHQVDYNHSRNEFVTYSTGTLTTFKIESNGYQIAATRDLELDFEKNMTAFLATAGQTIVIAFGNGQIITYDAESLNEQKKYQAETRSAIRQVGGSPNGHFFAALYRNGNLWLLDTEHDQPLQKAPVIGQGQIGTFAFAETDRWWVAENTDRTTEYDLSSGDQIVRNAPTGSWIENIFRYALRPLYRVCPKPGEFYKLVTHLSSSGDASSNQNVDLNKTEESSNPWSPLWSGLAFMFGMLVLGCVVFQFKDY